jgi:hypothetical protein
MSDSRERAIEAAEEVKKRLQSDGLPGFEDRLHPTYGISVGEIIGVRVTLQLNQLLSLGLTDADLPRVAYGVPLNYIFDEGEAIALGKPDPEWLIRVREAARRARGA